jgi:MFS family permease
MIFAAIASGQIVARVGRYKLLMVGSLTLLAFALFLMTNLRADTDRPILWLWMVVAGLGIGPSLAVFTLIVQNAVNPDRIGVATSSLTFFQQIGGTVGLTLAGTILADRLQTETAVQIIKQGVPAEALAGFSPSSPAAAQLDLFGTGDLAGRLAAVIPPEAQAVIPAIVKGVHEAFSIAIASTFWIGIGGAIIAAVVVAFLHEVPMRDTMHIEEKAPQPVADPAA